MERRIDCVFDGGVRAHHRGWHVRWDDANAKNYFGADVGIVVGADVVGVLVRGGDCCGRARSHARLDEVTGAQLEP